MADVKVNQEQIKSMLNGIKNIEREMSNINKKLSVSLPNKLLKVLVRHTPKDSGETSNAWKVNQKGTNGFSMENGRGGIIEFLMKGVKPHKIEPKDKSVLTMDLGGSVLFAKFVDHPGYSKQINADSLWQDIFMEVDMEINRLVTRIFEKQLKRF